jgi:hypothetical protein
MAYDRGLAQRVRELLEEEPGFDEKKMFGGICFLVHGNMAAGIIAEDLIVRVGPDRYEESLARPHARPFDLTGRPMKGWVQVAPGGFESDRDLAGWVRKGLALARSLPPK